MATREIRQTGKVLVNTEWWDSVQTDIGDAIERCNDITAAVAAHQHTGKYSSEQLLDLIEGWSREIRKLLEAMQTPI